MRALIVFIALSGLSACPSKSAETTQTTSPTIAPKTEATSAPRRTAALDTFFSESLSRWIVALSGAPETTSRPQIPPLESAALTEALEALFSTAENIARGSERGGRSPALGPAITRVNSALRASKLDYALDSVVVDGDPRPTVLVFSFTIERTRRYRGRSGEHIVLRARRFDQIAYRYQMIGFTGPDRQPLVLLDGIDRLVTTGLFGLAGLEDTACGAAIAEAALRAAIELTPAAKELAEALLERRALFARWQKRHTHVAWQIPITRLVEYPFRKMLRGLIPESEIEELADIETRLARAPVAVAYSGLLDAIATATEHHELQHQLDLASTLTSAIKLDLTDAEREHVLAEASAVLAELVRSPRTVHLSVARLGRVALGDASLERTATRLALAALLSPSSPTPASGEELEVQLKSIATLSAASVSSAAARAWAELFGHALEELELVHEPGVQASP